MRTYLWPFGHNTPFIDVSYVWKRMTLKYRFQGQLRSHVNTDLNSQHVVSYLLPIQTMALYVTVFEIFNICVCMWNPIPSPNFGEFWGKRPLNRNGVDSQTPNGRTLRRFASFEPFWTLLALSVWSVALSRNLKKHARRICHPLAGARPLTPDGSNLAGLVLGQT